MKGSFKVSLHRTGDFQQASTQEYEKRLRAYGAWRDSRHMEKWNVERPVKLSILAIRILIPGTELRCLALAEAGQTKKLVHWISAPPEADTVSVEIFLANAHLRFTDADPPGILARWALPSGEAVSIRHRVEPTPSSINQEIADRRSQERTKLDGRRDWEPNHPEGRILIFGPNERGWRSFLDVAAAPLASGSVKSRSGK